MIPQGFNKNFNKQGLVKRFSDVDRAVRRQEAFSYLKSLLKESRRFK